ncbi:MAG: DUF6798 domain-containing protein, partial [Planctomycetaceae bacterium]
GLATKWLTLADSALVGRVSGLLLLAIAWVSLTKRLTRSAASSIPALLIFLGLHQVQDLSGEWLVGGIEGKVPSWAFGFLAVRFSLDRCWIRAGCLLGLSVSFHPVVGGWVTLTVVGGWLINRLPAERFAEKEPRRLLIGIVSSLIFAAPGLSGAAAALKANEVPEGLRTEVRDVDHLQAKANYIQVFGRLTHHLDPLEFGTNSWLWYAFLGIASLTLIKTTPSLSRSDRLWPIIASGTIIALIGLLAAWGPRPGLEMNGHAIRAKFLKLYPFRYLDLMLPAMVGIQLANALHQNRWLGGKTRQLAVAIAIGISVFLTAPKNSAASSSANQNDWQKACQWIDANTDPKSLYVTPRESKTFKWHANRAEWINHKDMPQEAAGIVEWNRRLWAMQAWRQNSIKDDSAYSKLDMYRLRNLTSADYLLTYRIGPIELEPVYENETYRLYRLPESP